MALTELVRLMWSKRVRQTSQALLSFPTQEASLPFEHPPIDMETQSDKEGNDLGKIPLLWANAGSQDVFTSAIHSASSVPSLHKFGQGIDNIKLLRVMQQVSGCDCCMDGYPSIFMSGIFLFEIVLQDKLEVLPCVLLQVCKALFMHTYKYGVWKCSYTYYLMNRLASYVTLRSRQCTDLPGYSNFIHRTTIFEKRWASWRHVCNKTSLSEPVIWPGTTSSHILPCELKSMSCIDAVHAWTSNPVLGYCFFAVSSIEV